MRNDYQGDADGVLDLDPGPIHGQGSARRTAGERSNELMPAYEREIRDDPADAAQGGSIRLPAHVVERIQQLNAAERHLTRDKDLAPTTSELALALDWWPNANIGGATLPSAKVKERAKTLADAENNHMHGNLWYPTAAQMAERLGWEADDVKEIRRLTANAISQVETVMRQRQHQHTIRLNAILGPEESRLEDFIKNSTQDTSEWTKEEAVVKTLMREDVEDAMGDLPPRLRLVLALRFGLMGEREHTLKEVGRKLDVTPGRVWQLQKQAFELLKKSWKLSLFKKNISLEDFIQYTIRRRWAPDDMSVKVKLLMREDLVNMLVDALPPRLRLVLAFRFGFIDDRPRTLEEVGRELGVTRERVRQLEKQALGLLKSSDKLPQTPRDFIQYILELRGTLD